MMQVVILCGGKATRMYPLTTDIPKSLIPIRGKPFLLYQLELLKRQGFTNILLCTGVHGDQIEEYIHNNNFGMRIVISQEPAPLGTGGALYHSYHLLNNSFFVMYGDSYLLTDLEEIQHKFTSDILLTIFRNKNPNYQNNVSIIDGQVIYNKQKGNHDFIDYGFVGITRSCLRDAYNLDYIFHEYKVNYIEVQEPFYEIGSPEGLKAFKEFL